MKNAEFLWKQLVEGGCFESYKSSQWHGSFSGTGSGIYFSCGEGCCDNYWDNKEEFVEAHEGDSFEKLSFEPV